MRFALATTATLLVTSALCSPARGEDKPPPHLDAAELSAAELYQDPYGNFLLVGKEHLYYGDGKAMCRQGIMSASSDSDGRSWLLYAPRSEIGRVDVELSTAKTVYACKSGTPIALKKVASTAAAAVKAKMKLREAYHDRNSHLLARDDDGIYYFIDRMERGAPRFRIWVGPKGAMKQIKMKNVVSDSAGEVFVTANGKLKLIARTAAPDQPTYSATWVKGKEAADLTVLPPKMNLYLIHRELGIYGKQGFICDDN